MPVFNNQWTLFKSTNANNLIVLCTQVFSSNCLIPSKSRFKAKSIFITISNHPGISNGHCSIQWYTYIYINGSTPVSNGAIYGVTYDVTWRAWRTFRRPLTRSRWRRDVSWSRSSRPLYSQNKDLILEPSASVLRQLRLLARTLRNCMELVLRLSIAYIIFLVNAFA